MTKKNINISNDAISEVTRNATSEMTSETLKNVKKTIPRIRLIPNRKTASKAKKPLEI